MTRRRATPRSPRASRRGRRPVEPPDAVDLQSEGWVEYGGELIWAVGFTAGGAPFGLRACEFDPADLAVLGLGDASRADESDFEDSDGAGE